MHIRDILGIPDTYRAMPEKKIRRTKRPEIPSEIKSRYNQLIQAGVPAQVKYDSKSKSYHIVAKSLNCPEWTRKEVALC